MTTLPDSILQEFGTNAEYVSELYAQWRYSPVSVAEEWRRYFEGLGDVVREAAPPSRRVAGVPADLDAVCGKCLEKDRELRYAGAIELAEDLQRWR